MPSNSKYFAVNKESWNKRVETHFQSEFYDNSTFLNGRNTLHDIELKLLGEVQDKDLLHLQCHFGQDTLSWVRMGARVTGIDLSEKAIEKAQFLSKKLDLPARFVAGNVLETRTLIPEVFDLVFTSYGTITWLPELSTWAKVVSQSLKSGGKFCIVDFHPMLWTLDDQFESFGYPYFNRGVNHEKETGTYADDQEKLVVEDYWWIHPISDIISALLSQGLQLTHMGEYDYSNYNCLPNMEAVEDGKFRLKKLGDNIPYMFSMLWEKS